MSIQDILAELGLKPPFYGAAAGQFFPTQGPSLPSTSPIDGTLLGEVQMASPSDYEQVLNAAQELQPRWAMLPPPKRGEIVRQIGLELRRFQEPLAKLLSWEMGKILSEARGEVQEAIDIADFATGLSRQLYGLTMASERPYHRLYEQWLPLGTIGVITAFNFPVAVWAWNAMIAAVCGDTILWKPSLKTPLTSIATHKICETVLQKHNLSGVMNLLIGADDTIAQKLLEDRRLPLISFTGSCQVGKIVAQKVAARLGKCLLELGGNNAIIIWNDANLDLAISAVLFAAVGTAGQRCTTTRRVILHPAIAAEFTTRLCQSYEQVKIGHPLEKDTLMGPLISQEALDRVQNAIQEAKKQGGEVIYGGEILRQGALQKGFYMRPCIIKAHKNMPILQEETFGPVLYLLEAENLEEAIALQNGVPQGLSSAIFTTNLLHAETFLSPLGSDCGIANVNVGTSGAEIGGAFGGEKETGGGREAGSDAWKAYMRRQTVTINYSNQLPLAQGIEFGTSTKKKT
ncbi:MAG: aldehyde dehydrogenase family protein [Planctomycetota bacterium]|nr:MAG: aldehyde dehydrogenase family protein [Planctomycetota bacterium]